MPTANSGMSEGGGEASASPPAVAGELVGVTLKGKKWLGAVVTGEEGDLVLVSATPEGHEEIAKVPALEGKT